MLHDGVVDRIARAGLERRLVEPDEVGFGPGSGERRLARGQHVGPQPLQFGQVQRSREQKDAAVPEILARGDIALGGVGVGLFDKAGDRKGPGDGVERPAARDIAVAGFGPLRGDAERYEMAGASGLGGALDRLPERGEIADRVVRRHDQHQRIGVARSRCRDQAQRRDAGRRGGVAAERFEDQRLRRDADFAQLLGDDEAMLLVRDDERRGESGIGDATRRLLQQAALASQRQKLLRVKRARHRPQPRSRAARQDNRMDHANASAL